MGITYSHRARPVSNPILALLLLQYRLSSLTFPLLNDGVESLHLHHCCSNALIQFSKARQMPMHGNTSKEACCLLCCIYLRFVFLILHSVLSNCTRENRFKKLLYKVLCTLQISINGNRFSDHRLTPISYPDISLSYNRPTILIILQKSPADWSQFSSVMMRYQAFNRGSYLTSFHTSADNGKQIFGDKSRKCRFSRGFIVKAQAEEDVVLRRWATSIYFLLCLCSSTFAPIHMLYADLTFCQVVAHTVRQIVFFIHWELCFIRKNLLEPQCQVAVFYPL